MQKQTTRNAVAKWKATEKRGKFWKIREIDQAILTWESSGRRRGTATNTKMGRFYGKTLMSTERQSSSRQS
jgi:hypothetical protein